MTHWNNSLENARAFLSNFDLKSFAPFESNLKTKKSASGKRHPDEAQLQIQKDAAKFRTSSLVLFTLLCAIFV